MCSGHVYYRNSIGSRQIATSCIEHAFSTVKAHSIPLTPLEQLEMESFKSIYRELGGALDIATLETHDIELRGSVKAESSPKNRSSFRSSMFGFGDEELIYRNVDALISEAIAIRDLADKQMHSLRTDEAAENFCRSGRYFRMLQTKIPTSNSRHKEVEGYIQGIMQRTQNVPDSKASFNGRAMEHIGGRTE